MNLLLLASAAHALTLDDVVARAAEIDPDAVVAELQWRQARLDAAESWTALGVTPSVSVSRRFAAGTVSDSSSVSVTAGALDASAWFDAEQQSAQARAAKHTSDATTLDAQYAAASSNETQLTASFARAAGPKLHDFASPAGRPARSPSVGTGSLQAPPATHAA